MTVELILPIEMLSANRDCRSISPGEINKFMYSCHNHHRNVETNQISSLEKYKLSNKNIKLLDEPKEIRGHR